MTAIANTPYNIGDRVIINAVSTRYTGRTGRITGSAIIGARVYLDVHMPATHQKAEDRALIDHRSVSLVAVAPPANREDAA